MSVKLMSAIFETEFRDLKDEEGNTTKASTAKLVLLALADHANDEGEGAYPGLTKMERKTALSRQTVINTYGALKHNGIIFLAGISKRNTNNYTINVRSFPKASEDSQPILLVNPLDSTSQPTLPELVNPLDPNHPLTIQEPSLENPSKKTDDLQGEYITSIESAIYADVPVTDEIMDGLKTQSAAIMAFESAFGITSSSWAGKWHSGKPEWTRLRKWVVGVWQERPACFDEYVAFKKGDGKFFGLMDATQIARKPDDFYTSWDVFVRECAPPVEHTSNYYQPEDDSQFVPNPRTK